MTIHQILKQYWGFSEFRPLQEEIIHSVLDGKDTLALMPTGGGKSLCFQVPAMLNPGICIVVSPLIALMKDQVENLKDKGIKAIAIISGMGNREVDILLDNCIYGDIKFLYISPERLLSDLVQERIRHMKVNLIAIDEAHCISQWGYDFRPPYLHLSELRNLQPGIPVLALTATATERVINDIKEKLHFKNDQFFRKSFERKNLSYVVFNQDDKMRKLQAVAASVQGTGIVYVRNRRETQEVARLLNLQGISAEFYHAGLETPLRMKKQTDWKNGATRIMVATNAFGMGIDKADVRFVVHLDLPESLEAYYQEAGRAGRDEKKAFAVLLYNAADKFQLHKKLEQSFPSVEEIKQVYHHLGNYFQLAYGAGEGLSLEFDVGDFCSRFKLDAIRTLNALKFLERNEYIVLSENVFLPSRVQIITGQEELYRFQIEQPVYDSFIKTLLRSYGGIFDHFVPVKESDLSKRCGMQKTEIVKMLQDLQKFSLLNYLPQTDKPQLTYIKPRVDSPHLFINGKHIAERQHLFKQQIEAVIKYAEEPICRSKQLLNYFDESDAAVCGVCDVCLDLKRSDKKEFIEDTITENILQLLDQKHLKLNELVSGIKSGNEKEKLSVIRNLLDAGKIKTTGDTYYI
ncbi:RecQ family ATP-dependent DNA helicase [Daejeonella oryzae]|uniref:RecQ family ATP-dependent DNA helicase n=1 Tax=Daejeonella oryzae TaxID=1122943 RepID=UPI00041BDCC7|nr:ATP-dependent DNA helicase RecQ [Daejeonella oryzae]